MAGGAADSNGAIGVLLDEMSSAVTGHELTSPIAPILSGITTTMDMNNDSTAGVERQQLLEEKIANMVRRIYIPFTVAVGVPGNLLCFVTLVFTSLRNTSTCVYMAVIAVLDCVILTVALGFVIGDILGHSVFYMRNDWACGFHYFLFYFTIHFNVLLLLAMTVDRFIVVRFPLKAQRLCTPKSALKATVALGVVSFTLNSQILFTRRLIPTQRGHDPLYCWYPDPDVNFFVEKIYTWIDASIYSFIPFLSLLALNILIIRQLKQSSKFSKQFTERRDDTAASNANKVSQSNQDEIYSSGVNRSNTQIMTKELQASPTINEVVNSNGNTGTPSTKIVKAANSNIIVMLLLVTFAFLFLTSPVVIVLLYERYYWLPSTNEERARVLLTHAFVDNLMFSNHAINFLLYCISGRRFRQEFRQLLTRLCRS